MAAARHVGEQRGEQPAGTAFGGGELEFFVAGQLENLVGPLLNFGRQGGVEGFGHRLVYRLRPLAVPPSKARRRRYSAATAS